MAITIQDTTITGLTAGGLGSGVVTSTTLASNSVTKPKLNYSGAVIQTVQATYSAAWSSSSSQNWISWPISATITPTSASNYILIMVSHGSILMFNSGAQRILKNGSVFQVGDSVGSRTQSTWNHGACYFGDYNWGECKGWRMVDVAGTTSAITYQPQGYGEAAYTNTCWYNYGPSDPDSSISYAARVASTMVLMEIKV